MMNVNDQYLNNVYTIVDTLDEMEIYFLHTEMLYFYRSHFPQTLAKTYWCFHFQTFCLYIKS